APPSRIWPVLSEHEAMPRWLPVREVVRRRAGSPEPNGVGAVRTIRGMGLVVEEQITGWKPGERFEYVLTEGAPLRDHLGEMVLEPAEGCTLVRWSVRFRPLIPGTGAFLERMVRAGLALGLVRLKRLIESGESAG
ncbi:MAG TPA: SRPBCC family protein, partial [Myxococcota bacterium]|nr:SRPBCC family protein [Myxococcota bacterium]